MPLVGGFSRGSPISTALAFRQCSIHLFILIGSHDIDVKNRPNLASPLPLIMITSPSRKVMDDKRGEVGSNFHEVFQEIENCCKDMESVSAPFAVLEHNNPIKTSEDELPHLIQNLVKYCYALAALHPARMSGSEGQQLCDSGCSKSKIDFKEQASDRTRAAREVTSGREICNCEYQVVKGVTGRLDYWTRCVYAAGREHCTPVERPVRRGDGELVARVRVVLRALALPGLKHGNSSKQTDMPLKILVNAEDFTTCTQVDVKKGFQKCSFYREQAIKYNYEFLTFKYIFFSEANIMFLYPEFTVTVVRGIIGFTIQDRPPNSAGTCANKSAISRSASADSREQVPAISDTLFFPWYLIIAAVTRVAGTGGWLCTDTPHQFRAVASSSSRATDMLKSSRMEGVLSRLRTDEDEKMNGTLPECKGGGNGRSPGKTTDKRHRPARLTCAKNPGAFPSVIEPGSNWWEARHLLQQQIVCESRDVSKDSGPRKSEDRGHVQHNLFLGVNKNVDGWLVVAIRLVDCEVDIGKEPLTQSASGNVSAIVSSNSLAFAWIVGQRNPYRASTPCLYSSDRPTSASAAHALSRSSAAVSHIVVRRRLCPTKSLDAPIFARHSSHSQVRQLSQTAEPLVAAVVVLYIPSPRTFFTSQDTTKEVLAGKFLHMLVSHRRLLQGEGHEVSSGQLSVISTADQAISGG
ncbi:hypothetical protein PR048_002733 [Dryococelus australis]|uniref:Uncharacterized protein n=1 Tax=Dryococelus australis TaxID=614101 RepID=A0ABQ9IL57_9NEOP|nr:hypothetical protein PR048_002733 [Dryococelus australis]